jgi:hypothetical protein
MPFDSNEIGFISEVQNIKFQSGLQNHKESTFELYVLKFYKLFFWNSKMKGFRLVSLECTKLKKLKLCTV